MENCGYETTRLIETVKWRLAKNETGQRERLIEASKKETDGDSEIGQIATKETD